MDLTTIIEIAVITSRLLAGFCVVAAGIAIGVAGVNFHRLINRSRAQ